MPVNVLSVNAGILLFFRTFQKMYMIISKNEIEIDALAFLDFHS